MGERHGPSGYLPLASAALGVVVVLVCRAEPEANACPKEFPQTRLAATLLWSGQGHAWPLPGSTASPEDLALLEDPADSELCSRLAAALPDTLPIGGLGAPYFTAFYELGDAYVVPIVPRVTPAEIDAEARGETILWKEGVTLVFDRDLEILLTAPN
jgi:hypothetical protein